MNPYSLQAPFSVAFSGGETSGYMLHKIIAAHGGNVPAGGLVLFANTGLEHEETLKFVKRVGDEWAVPIVWLEYGGQKSVRVVDFETASRNGEPMDLIIRERGYLPNPRARICTVELKMRTMIRYIKSQGWVEWESAIGLRADEANRAERLKGDCKGELAVAPIYEAGETLADVEAFWSRQPFRLGIDRWMGNCVGCFLKARRKIDRLALESPKSLDWWVQAEERQGKPFRIDRPTYYQIRNQVQEQRMLFGDEDEPDMPCRCHE